MSFLFQGLLSRRTRITALALVCAMFGMGLAATSAHADNKYNALLSGGWSSSPTVSGSKSWSGRGLQLTKAVNDERVSQSQIWSAPAGVEFVAFSYTAADFVGNAVKSPGVGGLAGGFVAWDSDGNEVMFPWTNDCEIIPSNDDWVALSAYKGYQRPTGIAQKEDYCHTSGHIGWAFDNFETSNKNANFDGIPYTKLAIRIDCNTNTSCYSGSVAEAAVDNLSAAIEDNQSSPQTSALIWTSAVSGSDWYSTTTLTSPTLGMTASDPSGVCYQAVSYNGADGGTSGSSGNLATAPSVVTEGTPIGEEFGTTVPCDTASNYPYQLPASLTTGVYTLSAQVANAAQYQAGSFSGADASTVGGTLPTIHVDNTTPTISFSPQAANATAYLTVTAGPSGVGSVDCLVNGNRVQAGSVSGNESTSGTTEWSVPLPLGSDSVTCTAANGDANTALTASTSTTVYVSSTGTVSTGSTLVGNLSAIISSGLHCTRTDGQQACVDVSPTAPNHTLKLVYGNHVRLSGVVTNYAGQPLFNTTVTITAQVNSHPRSTQRWTTTTDNFGRFLFFVPAGPSRTITVVAGDKENVFHELTRSAIKIGTAGQAKARHRFYVTGQVLGGYLPSGGAILTVDYYTAGMAGYASLSGTYHSSANGRFKIRIPLNMSDVGRRYKIWVSAATEPGWPYRGSQSPPIVITVR